MFERYQQFIAWIGDGTELTDTLLHIHAGMAILLVMRVISGRSIGHWLPITTVFAAAFAKEIADRIVYGSWRMYDTPYDILNTVFWPTALWLGIRLRPLIDRERKPKRAAAESDQPRGICSEA